MKSRLSVVMTEEQKKQLKLQALKKGLTVSDYILSFLPLKEDKKMN